MYLTYSIRKQTIEYAGFFFQQCKVSDILSEPVSIGLSIVRDSGTGPNYAVSQLNDVFLQRASA